MNTIDVINSMNYRFDNPGGSEKVNVDEELINIASKSVMDPKVWEVITLFASMSPEEKAHKAALDQYRNAMNMSNGIKSKVA